MTRPYPTQSPVYQEEASVRFRLRLVHSLYRAFEIAVASAALVMSSPLMIVIAVLIRLDTPGPALFRQQRVGKNCKPFTFIKFRTHYVDAKERFPDWCHYQFAYDEISSFHFQVENDPRVTRFGRWLRRTSLDELPNFIHVLTGDVALAGPRPEMWVMLRYYHGEALQKFMVKPGITGYAQIFGRGDLSFSEVLAFDLKYVKERSVPVDLKILLLTLKQVIAGDGAY